MYARRQSIPLSKIVLIFIMCAMASIVSAAESGPKFLRKNVPAGLAQSTTGHFSVQMPIPFSEFSTQLNPDEGFSVMHGIIGKSLDGFVIGALKMERVGEKQDKDIKEAIQNMGGKYRSDPTALQITRDGDTETARAFLESSPVSVYIRVARTPRSIFTLTCEFQNDQRKAAESVCADFLNSFKEIQPQPASD